MQNTDTSSPIFLLSLAKEHFTTNVHFFGWGTVEFIELIYLHVLKHLVGLSKCLRGVSVFMRLGWGLLCHSQPTGLVVQCKGQRMWCCSDLGTRVTYNDAWRTMWYWGWKPDGWKTCKTCTFALLAYLSGPIAIFKWKWDDMRILWDEVYMS